MATAKLKAAPALAAVGTAPPKKSNTLLIVIAAVVTALAAGGGAAWFFLRAKSHDAPPAEQAAAVKKPPVFVTLEPFVVNLMQENGDHYLQIGLVYQMTDEKSVDNVKTFMPVIRNRILMLLSSKRPSEIATPEGKQKLVEELVTAARQSVPGTTAERGIESAMLSAIVIQ